MQDSGSVLHQGQTEQGSVAPENAADTLAQAAQQMETEQAGHEEAQQQSEQTGQGTANWDSDENPYKARLRGIQGRLQQEIESKRAYENRLLEMERQQVYQQAEQMHPQDRQAYLQQYQQQAAVRQRERELAQREQTMEQAARQYWVQNLSSRYGVPVQSLSRFGDPDSMEYHAQAIAEERRQRAKQNRQSSGRDRFEGESPGRARPDQKPKTFSEAKRMFVELAERDAARQ